MREFAVEAVSRAVAGRASYADARVVHRRSESLHVKNGGVENLADNESLGFGVRVIVDGAWGFASSSRVETREIDGVVRRALEIARASALAHRSPVRLAPAPVVQDVYRTPVLRDPLQIPLEEKLALLLAADAVLRKEPAVKISEATMDFYVEDKVFASSEGSLVEQHLVESGAGISATAIGDRELQRRSYPNSGWRGDFATAGYEWIAGMRLVEEAERVASEATALLSAKQCPSAVTTVIIDGSQMALQVHESCGHPSELDRALGQEASFAGTSFLTPEKLGSFQYGSELVNVAQDATLAGGLATFGYDDEGVSAQRRPIIEQGRFVGYLSNRETAAELNQQSSGAARADGWNRIPIVRMTNVSLEPGDTTLEDMIADTDEGIFVAMNRSWSIDDRRLNFQFGTEIGWEIKGGKLGAMLRNCTYTGITPEFWRSCDAIANRDCWHVFGIPSCGKGEPMQIAHVGHGAAPARFRNVRVGVGRW